jgi:hypothetical protein
MRMIATGMTMHQLTGAVTSMENTDARRARYVYLLTFDAPPTNTPGDTWERVDSAFAEVSEEESDLTELDIKKRAVLEEEMVTREEKESSVVEEGNDEEETVSNDDIVRAECNCSFTTTLTHTARRDYDEGVQSFFFFLVERN